MVVKSILMIIHIVSIKQEGSLSGLLYEFIPSLMVFWGVAFDSYQSCSGLNRILGLALSGRDVIQELFVFI